MDISDLW